MSTGIIEIIASTNDGACKKSSTSNWVSARDATAGDSFGIFFSSDAEAIGVNKAISGRTTTWSVSRVLLQFNTSGILHVPKTGILSIQGRTNDTADFIAVKGSWSGTPGIFDFDSIEGWVAGEENLSNITAYSDEVTTWNPSGTNTIALNQQALVDIAGQSEFNIVLAEFDYDLRYNEPSSAIRSGMYFANTGTSVYKPVIKITQQDDSVFFGANF